MRPQTATCDCGTITAIHEANKGVTIDHQGGVASFICRKCKTKNIFNVGLAKFRCVVCEKISSEKEGRIAIVEDRILQRNVEVGFIDCECGLSYNIPISEELRSICEDKKGNSK